MVKALNPYVVQNLNGSGLVGPACFHFKGLYVLLALSKEIHSFSTDILQEERDSARNLFERWLSAWLSTNDRDALPGWVIKPVEGSDLHKRLVRLEGLEPPTF